MIRVLGNNETCLNPVEESLIDRGQWNRVIPYEEGRKVDQACCLFPVTSSIISTITEATTMSIGVVCLSILQPGTHVVPHCGPSNARLRVHLGIDIPADVFIRVKDNKIIWKEGCCFVFDDSFEHEIWHRGCTSRIILLFDIWHPDLKKEDKEKLEKVVSFESIIKSFMEERGLRRISCERSTKEIRFYPKKLVENAVKRHMWENDVKEVELRGGKLFFLTLRNSGSVNLYLL